jgi:outer membrane lipoprotein-sorting protein
MHRLPAEEVLLGNVLELDDDHRSIGRAGRPQGRRRLLFSQAIESSPGEATDSMVKRASGVAILLFCAVGAVAAIRPAGAAERDDDLARTIVEKADEIRFPRDGFQVDVAVKSRVAGEEQEPRLYRILSKGNESTIVQTLEPPAERGQNMLMKGRELWVFLPNVSQPVRLSLSQRLTGQVANGDLARANFTGDYEARLSRTETLGTDEAHVLELTATDRGITYPKVLYWVRKSNGQPHKAEFYSLSGRLLKTCVYEDFKVLAGKVRPTRLVLTDALKKDDVSVMEYSAMKPRDLPDRMFTKEYLKRLD